MTRAASPFVTALLGAAALLTAACPSPQAPPETGTPSAPAAAEWKPSEGCPPVVVPPGDYEPLGDPRACKGGRIVLDTNSYPTHLNYYGPERDTSLALNYVGAMFVNLLYVHPVSLAVIPQLAASWEEPERGRVFVFHLDPDAVWSDGKPVVAADVLATWDLIQSSDVTEVLWKTELEKFNKPTIVDDHTVRWEAKTTSWRNILTLADFVTMPAHAIDPKTYLDAWHWKPPVVNGPYELGTFEDGKFFEFVRRKDWWGAGKRWAAGLYNFDSVYWKIVENDDISFEYFKKGDVDYHLVTKAQRWHEETEFDKVQKGWIQKQRMYMRQPEVHSQMAMNLEHPIFKDPKVRRALFWLLDREQLHDQLFYHEYINKNSYFANSIYENPSNEKVTFNPEKGLALLAEAGWTQRDKDGILMKDGKRLEFDFVYIHSAAERIYTPLQDAFRKHGVQMNLKLIQPSAWIKVSADKEFEMIYANWGSSPFPHPRLYWHSENADKKDSNNIQHFRDPRVDALIEQYEAEFDLTKRAEICRQIDALVYEQTPYLLDWYAYSFRNMWWDKFGMPKGVSFPTLDIRNTNWMTWWYDEARAKRLEAAMAADATVPRAPAEDTTWKAP